jgi:outer membrane receptor protein involved in Fe transport
MSVAVSMIAVRTTDLWRGRIGGTGAALLLGACLLGGPPLVRADEPAVPSAPTVAANVQVVVASEGQGTVAAGAPGNVVAADSTLTSDEASNSTNRATASGATRRADQLDTVVVTGRNDPPQVTVLQEQKDIPQSISIVSGNELQQLNAVDVAEVFRRISNVQWNYGNPMTSSTSIRGITTGGSTTIDPSLGITVDGVPWVLPELAVELDYVDVASISVEHGPQGSTGGINTSTGVITVVNTLPSFTPEARVSLTGGQLSTVFGTAIVGGPVIDDLLAWRATFSRDEQKGPYNQSYPDNQDRYSWDNIDRTFARLQFLLTPSDDFNVLLSVNSKPRGTEFVNGLSQAAPLPPTYSDGVPTYVPNGAPIPASVPASVRTAVQNTTQNKYTRSYFTNADPNAYQNYLSYPVFDEDEKGVLNSAFGGLLKATWNLPHVTLQSTTGFESDLFQASNGVGEWNVTQDGGADARYRQESEEFSVTSDTTHFFDYKAGLFFLQTSDWNNTAGVRARYGSDAGAYDANYAQYTTLDANAAGLELMENSLNRLQAYSVTWNYNRTAAAFGQVHWHLGNQFTVTTGYRLSREDRQTSQNNGVSDDGFGASLDPGPLSAKTPAAFALDPVAYSGFDSNAATGALAASNTPAQLALANSVAQQYFNVATYAALTPAQQAEVAAAKAIRAGIVYNKQYPVVQAQSYIGTLPSGNLSFSYAFTPKVTGYLTWQHGAKSGISQISGVDNNGIPISRLVAPESSNAYELGLKGSYFDDTLTANADVYVDFLDNFQQTVYILDPVLTAQTGSPTYTSITGNAPLVQAKGFELDAAYTGIKHLTLRFSGDWSHAFYDSDILLPRPVEQGDRSPSFYDANGQTLSNAPKVTANLSGEYSLPVLGSKLFHANFNYHYFGTANYDASNSEYAWIKAYELADFGIGLGRQDRKFDVNLIVKNAFNTAYHVTQTWTSYTPGLPRYFAVAFSASLY